MPIDPNLLSQLEQETKKKLAKALKHLVWSYKKLDILPIQIESLNEEQLALWESFAARFARVAELFMGRYLRTRLLLVDPGFSGTLRDSLEFAEKLGIIEDANVWFTLRELRNITAHEYTEKDLQQFFLRLKQECPHLLALQEKLNLQNASNN